MKSLWLFLILGLTFTIGENLIEHVDKESGAVWKATDRSIFKNKEAFKRRLGVLPDAFRRKNGLPIKEHKDFNAASLPDSFDARIKWPQCDSIKFIWDQNACGSCWAVSAANAMSDRLCIHKNISLELSPYDILSCCGTACGSGCDGGYPDEAWKYYQSSGVVTGGDGDTCNGCVCYPYPRCFESGYDSNMPTPECPKTCRKESKKEFKADKYYGQEAYQLLNNETQIRYEIMTNGPVQATFIVYEDFFEYRSGIYFHSHGKEHGSHAIRIIGWGVDNSTPYWLVTNSWCTTWGESGLFRMKRGNNECRIEEFVLGGLPMYPNTN